MVEFKSAKVNYEIRDVAVQRESDGYVLQWSYQKGNGFLIIVLPGREKRELGTDMASEIDDHWQQLMEKQEYSFPGFKAFYIRESVFASQEKRFVLKKKDVDSSLPVKIHVFSCEQEENNTYIYKGKENICYIPRSVMVSSRYKNIWFSKKKRCLFKVNAIKEYPNGMLRYRVGELSPEFPLTSLCIGKEMVVTMQRNAFLEWKIAEEYEKLYEVEKVL